MSNEELYDRMRQQRMLREELRDKKKELEDMMRKEHALKQNSRNQDTQSDVVSYSNKSDQFGLGFLTLCLSFSINPLKPISSKYYSLPSRHNLPFLISDIRALWRSGLSAIVPKC